MEIKEVLKAAKQSGLCAEWQDDFKKNASIPYLCAKYFAGSDWAMEHDFPTAEMLRKIDTSMYGLHVDYTGALVLNSILNRRAFFGNSRVRLDAGSYTVSEIYVRHNSELTVFAKDNARMVINVLDGAKVTASVKDDAEISIYAYGSLENITAKGRVKVTASKFD